MQRDYDLMRLILKDASSGKGPLGFEDFARYAQASGGGTPFASEMERLRRDGLLDADLAFAADGRLEYGTVRGLTEEGEALWRLIENDKVWGIVRGTLAAADVDVSYPLLKEVCEEIVKRYVTSFIPKDL